MPYSHNGEIQFPGAIADAGERALHLTRNFSLTLPHMHMHWHRNLYLRKKFYAEQVKIVINDLKRVWPGPREHGLDYCQWILMMSIFRK